MIRSLLLKLGMLIVAMGGSFWLIWHAQPPSHTSGATDEKPAILLAKKSVSQSVIRFGELGVDKNSSSTSDWYWDTTTHYVGESLFIVGGYEFHSGSTSDDISYLWINPNPSTFGDATAPPATPFLPLAQYATQAAANPAVQVTVHRPVTVSEIREPATQLRAQPSTDAGHTLPVVPLGLLPHRVSEFLQALLPWQPQGVAEVITQKVKAFRARVHNLRLGRMQRDVEKAAQTGGEHLRQRTDRSRIERAIAEIWAKEHPARPAVVVAAR